MYDLLYAPPKTKVKFLNKNGYERDPVYAQKVGLVEGEWYTLKSVDVHSWSSNVVLDEFPNHDFNSVMFESAPYEEEYTYWMDRFNAQCGF